MSKTFIKSICATAFAAALVVGLPTSASAEVGFGKPGEAVNLVIGYPAVLYGIVVWRCHQWQRSMEEAFAERFNGEVRNRPSGFGDRRQAAR